MSAVSAVRVDVCSGMRYARAMAEEKEFVEIANGKPDLQKKLKAWSNTIKRDGRKDRGWTIRTVHRGSGVYWIYLIGPKK